MVLLCRGSALLAFSLDAGAVRRQSLDISFKVLQIGVTEGLDGVITVGGTG